MKLENSATRRKTELKKSKDPEEDDSSGIKSRNKEAARRVAKLLIPGCQGRDMQLCTCVNVCVNCIKKSQFFNGFVLD